MLRVAFFALAAFAGSASARCEADCFTSADCSTCGANGHYLYASALYSCVGAMPHLRKEPTPGKCKLDADYVLSPEYQEMAETCRTSLDVECCEPHTPGPLSTRLKQCERRSCRIATNCTMGGVCEYNTENPRQGRTRDCCNVDADCPPYPAPHFWDVDTVPPGMRMCTVVRCDKATRSCAYSKARGCCLGDDDCTVDGLAKCTFRQCVFDPLLADAVDINPYSGESSFQKASAASQEQATRPGGTPNSLRTYRGIGETPTRCEERLRESCGCDSDADCEFASGQCAVSKCLAGVCVSLSRFRTIDKTGGCCAGNQEDSAQPLSDEALQQQCAFPGDPCMVPVSCSSTVTDFHGSFNSDSREAPRDTPLLPRFECRYVRRNNTATCCANNADCARHAENSCIKPVCSDSNRCELNADGYAFGWSSSLPNGGLSARSDDAVTLPCCFTDADCNVDDSGALARRLVENNPNQDACVTLHCDAANYRCLPTYHDQCPSVGASVVTTTAPVVTGVDVQQAESEDDGDLETAFVLGKCTLPISVRFQFYEEFSRFVKFPLRVLINIGLDGYGVVTPSEWASAFKVVSVIDRSMPQAKMFPLPTRRLFRDATQQNGAMVYRVSYDTSALYTAQQQVKALNLSFTLFLATEKVGALPVDAQKIFVRASDSNVTMEWGDEEVSKSLKTLSFANRFDALGCDFGEADGTQLVSRQTRGGEPQWIEVPLSGSPTFAPTLAPSNAPTFAPTPAPTFPPTHISSGVCNHSITTMHCDALFAGCAPTIVGECANIVTLPGICVSTTVGVTPILSAPVIPGSAQRNVLGINPPIVSNLSFCYAAPGQCKTANLLDVHVDNTPCTCDCACTVTQSGGNEYFSECRAGPLNTGLPPTSVFTITFPPTFAPTFQPAAPPGTSTPTPSPVAGDGAQCGTPQSPCFGSASCEYRNSTCNSSLCYGGCGADGVDSCTTNADCASRECCGCDIGSGLGYTSCIVTPFAGTPSPTAPPTSPTLSPTKFPTNLPTKQPTAFPTPPPTPVPTPVINGALDTKKHRCKDSPWVGPWIGESVLPSLSNYTDNVVNTKITVEAIAEPCIGCAKDFVGGVGSHCRDLCMKGNGMHFSIPFNITIENFDKVRSIPLGDDGSMLDGFVLLVNVTNVDFAGSMKYDPTSTCITIAPIANSTEISPPSVDAMFPHPNRRPSFSAHREATEVHSFIVYRGPVLPRMPVGSGVPTKFEFQIRVEGCGAVPLTAKQYLRVEARLVTGPCDELVDRWLHCFPNPYPSPNTTDEYIYDYRQCDDGYFALYTVGTSGNSPYGQCTQCPPTPAPTFPSTVSTILSARNSGVLTQHLAVFNASSYTSRGVVVAIVEDVKERLSDSGVASCAVNNEDAALGLEPELANRFLCSVTPNGGDFEATNRVGSCADSSYLVNVIRFPVDIHNVNPTSGAEKIAGKFSLEVTRKSYDPSHHLPCDRFYALYKFERPTGATVTATEVSASDDKNKIKFDYAKIPSNDFIRVYVYLLLCDNADFSTYPLQLHVSAKAENDGDGSNGDTLPATRTRDSYTFNITDISPFSTFECSDLTLGDESQCADANSPHAADDRCGAASLDIPCNQRCKISHARPGSTRLIVGLIGLCCIASCVLAIFCAIRVKAKKLKVARPEERPVFIQTPPSQQQQQATVLQNAPISRRAFSDIIEDEF